MGDLVDLDVFRKQKEKEEADEEQRLADEMKDLELAELEYLKEVLDVMVASFPPITGAFYDYRYADSLHYSSSIIYPAENDISPSDQIFFDYDYGWASVPDEDEGDDDF